MVLFYCGHEGAMSQVISIRCHRHTGEEAVLAVSSAALQQSDFAKRLVEEKIFNEIILVLGAFSLKEESVEIHEQKIRDYFDTLVEQNNLDLNNFSDIYISQDITGEFLIYLSMRNIQYILIEMYMENFQQFDNLSKPFIFESVKAAHSSYTEVLQKHKALYGDGGICKKRLRAENGKSNHSKSLYKDEWLDFNFLFDSISDEYKNIISKCLDENIHSVQEKDACLVLSDLPNYLTPNTQLDYADMRLVHQLALDYYNRNDKSRIIVKEHPHSSPNFTLDKYIERSIVLDPVIPIEFYKLIQNFSINKALSITTSALEKITGCVKENIQLGQSYYGHFRLCHKLFFAFSLHLRLNSGKTVCNYAKGFNAEFIHNFARFCFDDLPDYKPEMEFGWQDLKGDNFTIINEVPPESKKDLIAGLDGADPLSKIVFLNTKKDFTFFDFERLDLLKYITPFVIEKTAVSNKCISDTKQESLFLFCKDKAVRDAAKTFSMQKSLKHTKLTLYMSAVSWEEVFEKILPA
jgi:hypothetical protein